MYHIINLFNDENCSHDVYIKDDDSGYNFDKENVVDFNKFILDKFQEKAFFAINRLESLIVISHTSSGKTTIAEHAVNTSLRYGKKLIFTSPTKALTNQKFNDFKNEFNQNVGIITGDTVISADSNILLMTTEVLYELLLSNDIRLRDVLYIVYDEAHYIADVDRGTFWEQSLMLLPSRIRFILLSSTISNGDEVAKWLFLLKRGNTHLIQTKYRKIPLEYCLFDSNDLKSYQIKNFESIPDENAICSIIKGNEKVNISKNILKSVVTEVMEKNCFPVIIYCNSKMSALRQMSFFRTVTFISDIDKQYVEKILNLILSHFGENHPVYVELMILKEYYMKGVGLHHADLLTITKEITEMLFKEELIKVLFSTETLSVGINMPTKTVIFNNIKKYDGYGYRYFSNNEFHQMCRRAGRRGIDTSGIVILLPNKDLKKDIVMEYLTNTSKAIKSQFALSSASILKLMLTGYTLQGYFKKSLIFLQSGSSELDKLIFKKKKFLYKEGYLEAGDVLTKKGRILLNFKCSNALEICEMISSKMFEGATVANLLEILCCLIKHDNINDEEVDDDNEKKKESFFQEKIRKLFENVFNKKKLSGVIDRNCVFKAVISRKYYMPLYEILDGGDIRTISITYTISVGPIFKMIKSLRKLVDQFLNIREHEYTYLNYNLNMLRRQLTSYEMMNVSLNLT